MINAFRVAKTGMNNYQNYLDAVGNNVSNINTENYKAQNIGFANLMNSDIITTGGKPEYINGSRMTVTEDLSQGAAASSEKSSDVMINGNGFFAVQEADGTIAYTRSGHLSAAEVDGVSYLVNSNGDYVLDPQLNKIEIDPERPFDLNGPGENNTGKSITVGLFTFTDVNKLVNRSEGKYVIPNGAAVTAIPDNKSTIVMNMLELSNVDLVTEMQKLITAQRGYQLNVQMVQTADEMEQYANNLSV